MLVPTIDLVTVSDIWSTTIQDRLVYHTLRRTTFSRTTLSINILIIMTLSRNTFAHNGTQQTKLSRKTLSIILVVIMTLQNDTLGLMTFNNDDQQNYAQLNDT